MRFVGATRAQTFLIPGHEGQEFETRVKPSELKK